MDLDINEVLLEFYLVKLTCDTNSRIICVLIVVKNGIRLWPTISTVVSRFNDKQCP